MTSDLFPACGDRAAKSVLALTALLIGAPLRSACSAKKTTVGLDVDLYLHTSSSDPADVMLQAGIGKRLEASNDIKGTGIHVRVVEGVVTLSGAVKTDMLKNLAESIARETEISLNGTAIRAAAPIRNQIEVEP